jgi:DNA-binding IclR family transcriptional regulator
MNKVLQTIAGWDRTGGMKLSDIARRTGLSKPRLDAVMLTLKESGLIDRAPMGVSFTAGWSVTPKGMEMLK